MKFWYSCPIQKLCIAYEAHFARNYNQACHERTNILHLLSSSFCPFHLLFLCIRMRFVLYLQKRFCILQCISFALLFINPSIADMLSPSKWSSILNCTLLKRRHIIKPMTIRCAQKQKNGTHKHITSLYFLSSFVSRNDFNIKTTPFEYGGIRPLIFHILCYSRPECIPFIFWT